MCVSAHDSLHQSHLELRISFVRDLREELNDILERQGVRRERHVGLPEIDAPVFDLNVAVKIERGAFGKDGELIGVNLGRVVRAAGDDVRWDRIGRAEASQARSESA